MVKIRPEVWKTAAVVKFRVNKIEMPQQVRKNITRMKQMDLMKLKAKNWVNRASSINCRRLHCNRNFLMRRMKTTLLEKTHQRAAYWLKVAGSELVIRGDLTMTSRLSHDVNLREDTCQAIRRNRINRCLELDSAVRTVVKKEATTTAKEVIINHRNWKINSITMKKQDNKSPSQNCNAKRENIHSKMAPCTVVNGWEGSDTDMENKPGQMVRNMKENGKTIRHMDAVYSIM